MSCDEREVIRLTDTKMASPDELFVIERQDRIGGVQELGVEDDLDPIVRPVEELDASDLVEDGIVAVVGHVVSDDGRERVAAEGEDAALEKDLVFGREQGFGRRDFGAELAVVAGGHLEETGSDPVLDLGDRVVELLGDGLPLERFDGVRVRLSRHDDEGDHGELGAHRLEAMIEPGERFDEHVDALVAVLVSGQGRFSIAAQIQNSHAASDSPSGSEHVQGVVEIEVVVAVEVTPDKVVDLLLREGVHVLEFVHGAELDDVQAVRQDTV